MLSCVAESAELWCSAGQSVSISASTRYYVLPLLPTTATTITIMDYYSYYPIQIKTTEVEIDGEKYSKKVV